MRRLFLLAFTFVVILGASLGAFLFASLWPYYGIIGKFTAGLVILLLICAAALLVTFTYSHICLMLNRRRLIVAGDVVAYMGRDGVTHLSAMHEAAKVPPYMPYPQIEGPDRPDKADKSTIIDLYNGGRSLRDIVSDVNNTWTYYEVQKVTSEYKKQQERKEKKAKSVVIESD